MTTPQVVVGAVQHYAWGDTGFIPDLMGVEPDGEPWAELWLGTHPAAPSTFADGSPLSAATGQLPYLLKILAAAEPLSLQAHPTTEQAIDGYARGVYSDRSAKPELLVALTRVEALCGIRPAEATIALLDEIGADGLARVVAADGLHDALHGLYRQHIDATLTIEACESSDRPEARWVQRLSRRYPGDPSVAVTLLLNYVVLQPGDALHLTAGNLHAYLGGAGVELMQASDNVVRGGLTVKPVDLDELLRIIDTTPLEQPVMVGASGRYPLPEAGVELVRLDPGDAHTSTGDELTIGLDGVAYYLSVGTEFTPTATTYVVTPLAG